jgi:hypothetical protein
MVNNTSSDDQFSDVFRGLDDPGAQIAHGQRGLLAARCLLGGADAMRRSFLKLLDSTPREYRSRFRSSGI